LSTLSTCERLVLECPKCGGHSEAVKYASHKWRLDCNYCIYIGYFSENELAQRFDRDFGIMLLQFRPSNPHSTEYVIMSVSRGTTVYVLSNTEIIYEGNDLLEASRKYYEQVRKIEPCKF
jgi:ribosomal protein S27AE